MNISFLSGKIRSTRERTRIKRGTEQIDVSDKTSKGRGLEPPSEPTYGIAFTNFIPTKFYRCNDDAIHVGKTEVDGLALLADYAEPMSESIFDTHSHSRINYLNTSRETAPSESKYNNVFNSYRTQSYEMETAEQSVINKSAPSKIDHLSMKVFKSKKEKNLSGVLPYCQH